MAKGIYISEWLTNSEDTSVVASQLISAISEVGLEPTILDSKCTNDYWCRDYMPLPIGDGRYVGYNYAPDYLTKSKYLQRYITDQNNVCREYGISLVEKMDIILDGGNYVRCDDKVIMTDKIFVENPDWLPVDLLSQLESSLEADIILLPWDMNEPFGHADGMVSYLSNGKVLMNNFRQTETERNKPFTKRVEKILDAHFDVTELSYPCSHKDSWCYQNYLETDNAVILPALSEKHDCDIDCASLEVFQKIFDKDIVQVYAKPIVKNGGCIHCVTW